MVEHAYINYLDSRRKMRELALSRGFYPVVAIDMNDNYGKGGKSNGKGRQSGGGGKSKGKSKGKGGDGAVVEVVVDPLSELDFRPNSKRIKEVPDETNMVENSRCTPIPGDFNSFAPEPLCVCVGKTWRDLVIHVLYGKKLIYIDDVEIKPAFTANGHYMINIFDDLQDVSNMADLNVKEVEANDNAVFLDTVITDEISDEEMDLEVDVDGDMVDQCVFHAVEKGKIYDRKLKFWEVYVDQGNLGKYLSKHYLDVEVQQFSLPQWNFECRDTQRDFRKLMLDEKLHHLLMAPECRLWSPMQNMNYRSEERKALLYVICEICL
eukprot:s447_g18.t1